MNRQKRNTIACVDSAATAIYLNALNVVMNIVVLRWVRHPADDGVAEISALEYINWSVMCAQRARI